MGDKATATDQMAIDTGNQYTVEAGDFTACCPDEPGADNSTTIKVYETASRRVVAELKVMHFDDLEIKRYMGIISTLAELMD